MAGLISKEGAAQIIAAELGISFENEKLKIDEIIQGMKKVNIIGKIISLSPVRTFTRKDVESKVVNFTLADDTSNIKVVLWDINHISLIEKGEIKEGSVVEILNGYMRDNEVHLGNFSEFKPSKESFENVVTEKIVKNMDIVDFRLSSDVSTRAFIVQAFEPKFFYVCPECRKKANPEGDSYSCSAHGKIIPEKRALINLVLDDGTETIRSVLFHEVLKEIGFENIDDAEAINRNRNEIIGKEMLFEGSVRSNKIFNTPEFVVNAVRSVVPDELISELEQ